MSQFQLILAFFGFFLAVYIIITAIRFLLFKGNNEEDIVKKSKERTIKKQKNIKKSKEPKKEKPLPTMAGTKK